MWGKPKAQNVFVYDHEIIMADTPKEGFRLELEDCRAYLKYRWKHSDGTISQQVWLLGGGKVSGEYDEDTLLLPGENCRRYHLRFAVDTAFSVTVERNAGTKLTLHLSAQQNYGGPESLVISLPYVFEDFPLLGPDDEEYGPELVSTECGFGLLDEATGRIDVAQGRLKTFKWNLVAITTQNAVDRRLSGVVSWNTKEYPKAAQGIESCPRFLTPLPRQLPSARWCLPAPEQNAVWISRHQIMIKGAYELACRWMEPDGTRRIETWRFDGPTKGGDDVPTPNFTGRVRSETTENGYTTYRLVSACSGIQVELHSPTMSSISFIQDDASVSPFTGEFWLLLREPFGPEDCLWQGDPFDEYGNFDMEKIDALRLPQMVGGRAVCVRVSPAGRMYACVYAEPVTLAQLADGYALYPGSAPLTGKLAAAELANKQVPPLPDTTSGPTVISLTVERPGRLTALTYFDGNENRILDYPDRISLTKFDRECRYFSLTWLADGSLQIRRTLDDSQAARLTLKWHNEPSIRLLTQDGKHTDTLATSSAFGAKMLRLQADEFGGMTPSLRGTLGGIIDFPAWEFFKKGKHGNLTFSFICAEEVPAGSPILPVSPKTPDKANLKTPAAPKKSAAGKSAHKILTVNKGSSRKEESAPMPTFRIDALLVVNPHQLSKLKICTLAGKMIFEQSGGALHQLPDSVSSFLLECPQQSEIIIRGKPGSNATGKAVLEYFRFPSDSFKLRLLATVTGASSTSQIELPYVEQNRYGIVTLMPDADGGLIVTSENLSGVTLPFPALEAFKRLEEEKAAQKNEEQKETIRDAADLPVRCRQAENDLKALRAEHLNLTKKVELLLHILESSAPSLTFQEAQKKLREVQEQVHGQDRACVAVKQKTEQMQLQLVEISARQHIAETERQRIFQEREKLSRQGGILEAHQAKAVQLRQQVSGRLSKLTKQEMLEVFLQTNVQEQIADRLTELQRSWGDAHKALQKLQEEVRRAIAERDESLNHSPQ